MGVFCAVKPYFLMLGHILSSMQANNVAILQVDAEVDVPMNELIPQSDLVPLYTKSKNRGNFAALMVVRLFDKETRLKSNVRGRGKEKLDPDIMKYVDEPTITSII